MLFNYRCTLLRVNRLNIFLDRVRNVTVGRRVCVGQSRRGRRRQQDASTLLKLKGPRTEWHDNGDHGGIARFLFDTGIHSSLRFDLVDKKGFMCFSSEQSCGAHRYPFRQVRMMSRDELQRVFQKEPL